MTADWNYEPPVAHVFDDAIVPIYTTDADGWLTYYNRAAAELWGYHPEIGRTRWCGSWRIFTPAGSELPLDQCPMAIALKEGRPVRDVWAVLERPEGTLIPFMPYPTPIRAPSGVIIAGSNMLVALGSRPMRHSLELSGAVTVSIHSPDILRGAELDDLTGQLQSTLGAIADIEVAYQLDCERLDDWTGPSAEKERILMQLQTKRERKRTALMKRLNDLQERAVSLKPLSRQEPSTLH
ncbi:PAS domain-containing protein [Methylobacterium sp. CB376]|uniref:PAS domain-containing protein n=1 Tax=unclassified Methylobacterium TaxID=2615210 RepID=UPI00223EB086|nr:MULTISPECIES: PAS domain-containing protein [Methylobacterium]WFT78256.1 PAS domain-containing protein [Methylobacterium nodulans]